MFYKYRLVVCVEYKGTNYSGWQKNKFNKLISIQEVIENVLFKVADHKINIFCSSRTDKGVHSFGQIFHFDTYKYKSENEWLRKCNFILPNDIFFKWVKFSCIGFDSRKDSLARRYIYIILNGNYRSTFLYDFFLYYKNYLFVDLMLKASYILLGEHNFSSFKSSGCQSLSSKRNIFYINIFRKGVFIYFDIIADSFLYHMVRNIVSSLILVGIKSKSINWFKDFFYSGIRINCNIVKPNGLYLYKIYY